MGRTPFGYHLHGTSHAKRPQDDSGAIFLWLTLLKELILEPCTTLIRKYNLYILTYTVYYR